ncbi:MAG: glycosyltransferase family 4 protein [Pseudomonadales bacterium]|nr:glycosyltransferase family 4 protein [Pseudomonadales bacterium]
MKKILFITFNDCYGGGEVYLESLINATSGLDSYLYSPDIPKFISNVKLGSSKIYIGTSRSKRFLSLDNVKCYNKAIKDINNIIKEKKIDIVFLNGKEALYMSPFIKSKTIIAVAHTLLDAPMLPLKILLHFVSLFFLEKLIFVSNAMKIQLSKLTLGVYSKKFIVIHNGVDLERFVYNAPKNNENLKIVNISRLEENKGQDLLIRAFAILRLKYNNIRLEIGGCGAEKDNLLNLAKEEGVDSDVSFLGFIKSESLLSTADIFVMCSRWEEPFGLVIIEAMSSGVPVIASSVGGIPEIINHNESGFLFKSENIEEIVCCIEKLILNFSLRTDISVNARRRVEKEFDLDKSIRLTLELFND